MKKTLAAIASALAYFSILPVGSRYRHETPGSPAIDALPLVGIIIGAIAGIAGYAVSLVSTPWLGYAVAFSAVILLSGAIHLDGFLDSCDGLFASVEPQRRLEILKDPRHGTYAVAGMGILTVAWMAALSGLSLQRLPIVLAYAGVLARTSALLPMFFNSYARAAPSAALTRPPSKYIFFLWLLVACLVSFAISKRAWVAVPIVLAAMYLTARWIAKRLGGGLVGDSYGFLIAVAEPLVLFLLDIRV